jgi:hypothetical protein
MKKLNLITCYYSKASTWNEKKCPAVTFNSTFRYINVLSINSWWSTSFKIMSTWYQLTRKKFYFCLHFHIWMKVEADSQLSASELSTSVIWIPIFNYQRRTVFISRSWSDMQWLALHAMTVIKGDRPSAKRNNYLHSVNFPSTVMFFSHITI